MTILDALIIRLKNSGTYDDNMDESDTREDFSIRGVAGKCPGAKGVTEMRLHYSCERYAANHS